MLQKTLIGWIIAGSVSGIGNKNLRVNNFFLKVEENLLRDELERFWKIDDNLSKPNNHTKNEQDCVDHFYKNVERTDNGRFIVKLPFNQDILSKLGDSKQTAIKCFRNLEIRLNKDKSLMDEYQEFLREDEQLGHMSKIQNEYVDDPSQQYFFCNPHAERSIFDDSIQCAKRRFAEALLSRTTFPH